MNDIERNKLLLSIRFLLKNNDKSKTANEFLTEFLQAEKETINLFNKITPNILKLKERPYEE